MKLSYTISVVVMLPRSTLAFLSTTSRRLFARPALFATLPNRKLSYDDMTHKDTTYGGDFAGLSATFDSSTGSLISIPEYLVPKDLVEWGQVPSYLEVISSEQLSEKGETFVLERQTVKVLPAVGCGVDNLETTKSVERAELSRIAGFGDNKVVALEYDLPSNNKQPKRKRVETTFGLKDEQRLRIMMDLEFQEKGLNILNPITMVLERRTSSTSSRGTIADGGGLDGRTVSRLIGTDIRNDAFPSMQEPSEDGMNEDHDEKENLVLPGNITVGFSGATLDVIRGSSNGRIVVSRRFDSDGSLQEDFSYIQETD